MKKKIKAMQGLAMGGLTLGAMNVAGTALTPAGGTNLVGGLTGGLGTMMPSVGTMMGAGMTIDIAKGLMPGTKRRRKR